MDSADASPDRLRQFTLLVAQLAAQCGMSDAELAAASGGACAIGRLLRRSMAHERGAHADELSPELLVMVFDAKLRQRVSVQSDDTRPLELAPPAVSYQ
jgi:hypothetical protein